VLAEQQLWKEGKWGKKGKKIPTLSQLCKVLHGGGLKAVKII
jgi:hypothetical protein